MNLYTTHYANGDPIPFIQDSANWAALNTPAWTLVNNDLQNAVPYGHSYNHFVVLDPRNACPDGWHVPADVEWQQLVAYLGGEAVAGGKLKSTGDQQNGTGPYWVENYDASNESGFSAVPAGNRPAVPWNYSNFGYNAFFWSATTDPDDATRAWAWVCQFIDGSTFHGNYEKRMGFSIRCLKD